MLFSALVSRVLQLYKYFFITVALWRLDEELRSNYVKGLSWMEPLLCPLCDPKIRNSKLVLWDN